MRKSTFMLDATGEVIFEGYTDDSEWNGWAVPVFSFEQAQKIVTAWRALGWAARYNADADSFVFGVNQDLETGEAAEHETFDAFERDGQKFYAIGSGSWVWEEAEHSAVA